MRRRSRYDYRRAELTQRLEPPITLDHTNILEHDGLLDIANGMFGQMRIGCWLAHEARVGGRRWGKVNSAPAAIVPFRIGTRMANENVRLRLLEVELHVGGTDRDIPFSYSGKCDEVTCRPHAGIYLLDLPCPADIESRNGTAGETGDMNTNQWRFRSEDIRDCDRQSRAARWIWTGTNRKTLALHGAVTLRHQNSDFVVACKIRGKASYRVRGNAWIRLGFNDQGKEPALVKLKPKTSETDLSETIQNLEQETRDLNLIPSRQSSTGPPGYTETIPHSRTHGPTDIRDHARVHIGDSFYGYGNNTWPPHSPAFEHIFNIPNRFEGSGRNNDLPRELSRIRVPRAMQDPSDRRMFQRYDEDSDDEDRRRASHRPNVRR